MNRTIRKRRAFTVVELLIVVFIIMILAGMLLPGLAQAIEAARRTACVSNLRQIGLGVLQYRTNNNDWFFPVSYPARSDGTQSYFFGEAQADGSLDRTKGYLVPFLEEAGTVDWCPSFREGDFQARFDGGASWGYAYNYKYLGENGEAYSYEWPPGNVVEVPRTMYAGHSVKKPSRTVLFADSARINTWSDGADTATPRIEENFYLDPPSASYTYDNVHFRHNNRANVLFVDGHVESLGPVRWYIGDCADTDYGRRVRIGNFANDDTLYDRD